MAQHDYSIANGTGSAVRSDLNDALAAIVSLNSGATEPATTFAFQLWADTTANVLKLRNSANNAWITLRQLDGDFTTVSVDNGTAAAPSVFFNASGTDTGFYSSGSDAVDVSTAGTRRLGVGSAGDVTVFGGNVTLNAQGDLRFADSDSSNWVAFQAPATVASNVTWTLPSADGTADQALVTNGSGTLSWADAGGASDAITEGNTSAEVVDTGSDGHFKVITEGTERFRVDNTGRFLIGTTTPVDNTALEVEQKNESTNYNGIVLKNKTTNNHFHIFFNSDGNPTFSQTFGTGGSYRPLVFWTGNGERVRIDTSGRLLVGTSTARSTGGHNGSFQLEGADYNTATASITYNYNDADCGYIHFAKTRGGNTVVNNNDNLGTIKFLGTDGSNLIRAAQITASVDGTPGDTDMPGRLVFYTTPDGGTQPTERCRIDAYGSLCVNATQTDNVGGGKFVVKGGEYTSASTWKIGTNGYNALYFANASGSGVGSITVNASSVSYNNGSDYRLKENIVPLTGAIDRLNQLQVRRFNFIAEPDTTVDGFIAHEAQAVVPEAVTGTYNEVKVWQEHETLPDGVSVGDNKLDEDGNTIPVYQCIDQAKLVPLLTAALQEALAKIETLETRLTALENA